MPDPRLQRALGGSPLGVVIKLIFLSLIVGALMAFLGLTPRSLFSALETFVRGVWNMGYDAIREVGQWIIAGAIVVIPVWLIARMLGRR
ncbi:MAG: DUF6460 domain-containing protein [Hyphomonas sp.]|nr:DUF6460 domain-containing protein [Hyphomonas sp.]